jgi:hypothetical protein
MLLVTHVVVIIRLLWATSGALSWFGRSGGNSCTFWSSEFKSFTVTHSNPRHNLLVPQIFWAAQLCAVNCLPNCVLLTACPIVTFSEFFSCAAGLPNGTLSLLNGVRATLRLT